MGVRSPIIEEVITDEPDPLQRDDPWSNTRSQESYEVVPTHVSPTNDTTTTDSWSVYGSAQTAAASAAAEVATTTAVSPPAGEEPPAPRPSGSEPPQMSPIPVLPPDNPFTDVQLSFSLSGLTTMPSAGPSSGQSVPNYSIGTERQSTPPTTTAGPTTPASSVLSLGGMSRASHPVAATPGSLPTPATTSFILPSLGGNSLHAPGGNPAADLISSYARLNRQRQDQRAEHQPRWRQTPNGAWTATTTTTHQDYLT